MRFLKVTNRGTVHRKLLELVGFGTKRGLTEDLGIIGSKGSGIKLIVPASLRLGLRLKISSSDEAGAYSVRYEARDVRVAGEVVRQIYMIYDDGAEVPTQFTVESLADWDKPVGIDPHKEFKIVREIIANAKDADSDFRVENAGGESRPSAGETSVSIALTGGIEEMVFMHPERYFKFLGKCKPLFSLPGLGEVYARSSKNTRMFLQGVLVECFGTERTSLFDYSISAKDILSEDRVIKDTYGFRKKLARLILSVPSVEFAACVIKVAEKGKALVETNAFSHAERELPSLANVFYQAAWNKIYGDRAVISKGDVLLDEDARIRGYRVQQVASLFLKDLLIRLGIKQSSDVVSRQQPEYRLIELTAPEQEVFDKVYGIFLHFCPHAALYPVRFFETQDQKTHWEGVAGLGEAMFKEIWISCAAFSGGEQNVLETLIHELRHCVSGAQDYTAQFERQADKDMARLMMNLSPDELINKK